MPKAERLSEKLTVGRWPRSEASRTTVKGVKGVYLLNVELPGVNHFLRLGKNGSPLRHERPKTEDSSSRRIMRLVPVFILETHNQTD